jgi:hypothetical protein
MGALSVSVSARRARGGGARGACARLPIAIVLPSLAAERHLTADSLAAKRVACSEIHAVS